jgi:hypothetical protein
MNTISIDRVIAALSEFVFIVEREGAPAVRG